MSAQDDEKSRLPTGSQLWKFLNSSFGLFLLSSVGLSLVTWLYTELSQSVEQRIEIAETTTMLDTEISYRISLLQNYFQSGCVEVPDQDLTLDTFKDIRDIYKADPAFQAIFPENAEKDLHILIWEKAALLESNEKEVFVETFNELTTGFNAYLTRFLRQTERESGLFYNENPDLRKEVTELIKMFSTAIDPIKDEIPRLITLPASQTVVESQPVAVADVDVGFERADADCDDGGRALDVGDALQRGLPADGSGVREWLLGEPIPQEQALGQPFMMPVADVFSISGRGTVVTGRIERGIVKVNDEIEIVGIKETTTTTVTFVEMFRKIPDQGRAGDHVGVVLGGMRREDLERGQVLAKPGSITPHTKFEAAVYFLTKDEGGRHTPFFKGYRPQFYFRTTDVTGLVELPECTEKVMPGDSTQMTVKLNAPIAMEAGLRFKIREGGRMVGVGEVYQILE